MNYKLHTNCRCCGSANLSTYLDLGLMPMANDLQPTKDAALDAERYPLEVLFCKDCGLSQLSVVVDPEVMFSNYAYRSSMSQGYKTHCRQMAVELKERYGLHSCDTDFGSFVIDIAGNDGALLSEFSKEIPGLKHLNVDPARNLIPINEAAGIRQFCKFWNIETAEAIGNLGWPKADVITATNVFAHVDDVRGFLEAAKFALKPDGVLVLEFPYLIDFIEKGEWDTVYFEHLSYFSIAPLAQLCLTVGLNVLDVQKFNIHGGTVRVIIGSGEQQSSVQDFIKREIVLGYGSIEGYRQFEAQVQSAGAAFINGLASIPDGSTVAAFAASAKGNTLLNYVGGCGCIEYIVDETPEKVGKFSPGCGIEVVPLIHLLAFPVDYVIILSWNFAEEIKTKCRAAGFKGKFVIPIPTWEEVD
jgi:SAM-dependent methyltransferase